MTDANATNLRAQRAAAIRAGKERAKLAREAAAAQLIDLEEVTAAPAREFVQRNNPRETYPREAARSPTQSDLVIRGRDGEVLSRKRRAVGDIFAVPEDIARRYEREGYELQWNTYTVVNERAIDHEMNMYENGWRPVPADRHPGVWTPHGTKGEVIRGGMRLEERPTSLGKQAREEDLRNAHGLMRDQWAQMYEGAKSRRNSGGMPPGFSMETPSARRAARANMSIDPGLDIPRPEHRLAEPGE